MPINLPKNIIGAARNTPLSPDNLRAGGFEVAKCTYTSIASGGTDANTGTVALTSGLLPVGATIMGGYLDVTVALTGTGNAGLQAQATNDVVSTTAISGAPWSTISKTAITPVLGTFSTWLTIATSAKAPSVVLSGTLTAGAFSLYLFYIEP